MSGWEGRMDGTAMSRSLAWDATRPRLHPIACHECGAPGSRVGRLLPQDWHWYSNGLVLRYYCPNVICWQYSWVRSREEWASA